MDIVNTFMDSVVNFYNFLQQNITLDAVIKFVILYFFILWWAFIIWIVKDITNRTNILLQVFSILIVIFLTPIFWLPIYLLMRPRRTIFEKYYEEDELNQDEAILEEESEEESESYPCPKCWKEVSEEFKFCPYCEFKLTKDCSKCLKPLRADWKMFPYCGHHQEQEKIKKDWMKVEVEKVDKRKKKVEKEDILAKISEEA